jgi:hypothetical protein
MVLTFRMELKDFHDSSIFKNVFFNVRKLIGFKNSQKKNRRFETKINFHPIDISKKFDPKPS